MVMLAAVYLNAVLCQAVIHPYAPPGQAGQMAAAAAPAKPAKDNKPGPGPALPAPPAILQIPNVLLIPAVPPPLVTLMKGMNAVLTAAAAQVM